MSKVVKGIGRHLKKVVNGAIKIVKKTWAEAKRFAKSDLGKALITAAAIYFGGAAIAGGMGSSAAGGSFLSGMGTGVSSAASSLSSAWGSLAAGELGTAASTVGNAWGAAGTAASAGATATQAAMATAVPTAQQLGSSFAADMTAAGVKSAALPGSAAAGTGMFSSPYTAPALISGGTALIGGAMQGKALEDQRNFELEQQRLARERYGANVGTSLWGAAPTDSASASGPTAYQSIGYDQSLSAATPAASNYQQIDPATGQPMNVADLNRRSATAFNQIWQRPGLVGNYTYMNPSIYG